MVYNYLFDLYRVLAERKNEIERLNNGPFASPEIEQYHQGRLAAVNDFTTFLKHNYHAKLPRRIQKGSS
jgi:hypothetical protein